MARGRTRKSARRHVSVKAYRAVVEDEYRDDSPRYSDDDTTNDVTDQDDMDYEAPAELTEDELDEDNDDGGREKPQIKIRIKLPPKILDEEDRANMPELVLPDTSEDLLLRSDQLLTAISIYEILRYFRSILRLTPFRFEDFCAALLVDEQNTLLSEIHIVLLKALIREDEQQQTWYASQDLRDAVAINFYFADQLSWPDSLRLYLMADPKTNQNILDECLEGKEYPFVHVDLKLRMLTHLCDQILQITPIRDNLVSDGYIHHDDNCRVCHKLGDLLCCEFCPAVFHLNCIDPPLEKVPEDEWTCPICIKNQVPGVTDCVNEFEKGGFLNRQEPIGWDRHGRRYWFLVRRIFVESEEKPGELHYYSTKSQLAELIESLDEDNYEADLVNNLRELQEEIERQMDITTKLTNSSKSGRRSYIEAENEKLGKLRKERDALDKSSEESEDKKVNGEIKEESMDVDSIKKEPIDEDEEEDDITLKKEDEEISKENTTMNNSTSEDDKKTIQTRLKTGSIQPKSINLDPLKKTVIITREEELLVPNKDGSGLQCIKRANATTAQAAALFKLGQEAHYKKYVNHFSTYALATNKQLIIEERDRKRHLSHKFSLTDASIFKWTSPASVLCGPRPALITTLRNTIISFENQFNVCYMHPNWNLHRNNWLKAVNMCSTSKDFSLALSILESSMKPVLFNELWNSGLGLTHLSRTTFLEREERKKQEKRERREKLDEEDPGMYKFNAHVHYVFGKLKHQIWKQKGEEYRLAGGGGWYWLSSTRLKPYSRYSKPKPVTIVELTDEQSEQAETTPTINISAELRKKPENRIYYPNVYTGTWNSPDTNYPARFKNRMRVLETLLDRRVLQKQIEERQDADDESEKSSELNGTKLYAKNCYSVLCRNSENGGKYSCYAYDCQLALKKAQERDQEETRKRIEREEQEANDATTVVADCRGRISLHKIIKINGILQLASKVGKRTLGKGKLAPIHRYQTHKGKKPSILVLSKYDLKRLARTGAMREASGFNYNAKLNPVMWPFHTTPRPTFRTCWLYRNQKLTTVHAICNQFKILYASVRWDDLNAKPPLNYTGQKTINLETELITVELLKRKEMPPFGLRSQYLIRRVVVSMDQPTQRPREVSTPIRSGLRERKRAESPQTRGPTVTEIWVPEEELELWELKQFGEKVEKAAAYAKERALLEAKRAEQDRNRSRIEEQLRKQKEEFAKKREEQLKKGGTPLSKTMGSRFMSIINNKANGKKIFTTKNSPTTNSPTTTLTANSTPYAMIKTPAGQTFRVPLSALNGKNPGETIIIKTTAGAGGSVVSTTSATIISTHTPPAIAVSPMAANTVTIRASTPLPSVPGQTVLMRTQSGQIIPLPAQTGNSTTQFIRMPNGNLQMITVPTSFANPSNTNAQTSTTTSPTAATPSTSTITIKPGTPATPVATGSNQFIIKQAPGQVPVNAAGQTAMAQLPIKLANGQIQMVKIPISMLSSSQPVQISIQTPPAASATGAVQPQPQTIQLISSTAATTPTTTSQAGLTRVIQLNKPATPSSSTVNIVTNPALSATSPRHIQLGSTTVPNPTTPQPINKNSPKKKLAKKLQNPKKPLALASAEKERLLLAEKQLLPPGHAEDDAIILDTCKVVLKNVVDRVVKSEKNAIARAKAKQASNEARWKIKHNKHLAALSKHAAMLKRDMNKRRALYEKEAKDEIQREIIAAKALMMAKEKENTHHHHHHHHHQQQQQPPPPPPPPLQQEEDEYEQLDDIDDAPEPVLEVVVGDDNSQSAATNNNHDDSAELYCICRKPYNELEFYIGCDKCRDWLHGTCVGITPEQAELIDVYVCPTCKSGKKRTPKRSRSSAGSARKRRR